MGEMAEYYLEMFEWEWDLDPTAGEARYATCWKTKEGQWLKHTDMGTSHLRNTIALLDRRGFDHHPAYEEMKAEYERRMNK